MNFTREPILETIISAKEGYKLSIKSTKSDSTVEYLVDAVEVVCFGTTYFYRSGEPAHTFFIPAQDFEIMQVRQTRLVLKTPTEKNIKIAGGDTSKKGSDKSQGDKKKSRSKAKSSDKKSEDSKKESATDKKGENTGKAEKTEKTDKAEDVKSKEGDAKGKKEPKAKASRRGEKKSTSKAPKKAETGDVATAPSSIFSHLLRPPEALISDSIEKYQTMITPDETPSSKEVKLTKEDKVESAKEDAKKATDNPVDDPNLTSEAPKPYEKLSEDASEMPEKTLSLKEKVKKVLTPADKSDNKPTE